MTWEALKDYVLFGLAIYAAVLSSLNWWQSRRKDRRTLRVTLKRGVVRIGDGHSAFAVIEAVNTGHRTISITRLTAELPNKKQIELTRSSAIFLNTPLPATLGDGDIATSHVALVDMVEAFRLNGYKDTITICALAEDSIGNIYRSDTHEVNLGQLMNL